VSALFTNVSLSNSDDPQYQHHATIGEAQCKRRAALAIRTTIGVEEAVTRRKPKAEEAG